MNEPPPLPRRYWITTESIQGSALAGDASPPEWFVAEYLTGMLPDDVVYFCRPGPDAHMYGWGYVHDVVTHSPGAEEESSYPEEYLETVESSTRPSGGGDGPPDTFVRVTFVADISPELQLSDPPVELSPLREPLLDHRFKGRMLSNAQAAALNRLIRDLGLEAPPDPGAAGGGVTGEAEALRLAQALASYRLSGLSEAVLVRAGQLALKRAHRLRQVTSSCILFAATDVEAAQGPGGTAASFISRWFSSHRPEQFRREFDNFLTEDKGGEDEPADSAVGWDDLRLSPRASRIVETARRIARFVRKEALGQGDLIRGRDLVASLLLAARDDASGVALRLAAMEVSVEELLQDYHDNFLTNPDNADDDIEKWRGLLTGSPWPPAEEPPQEAPPEPDRDYIALLDADRPGGQDLLNIKPEVEGFASIIAAEGVKTPLSIGLFGDWGSGKSFFIAKLKEQVARIAQDVKDLKEGEKTPYLGNIVQIDFNAWHYVEANLWASLVSHVFDNLNRTDDKDEELAKERKQFLLSQLDITLKEQRDAEAKVKAGEEKYESAKAALDAALRQQAGARIGLRRFLRRGIWPLVKEVLEADAGAQDLFTQARRALGREGLPASAKELKAELEASRTVAGRAQLWLTALRDDPLRGLKLLGLLAALLLVPLGVTLLLSRLPLGELWERAAAGVTPLLTLLGGALAWLRTRRGEVAAATAMLDEAKGKLDALYEDARRDYAGKRLNLEEAVAAGQVEVEAARNNLEAAKKEVRETVAELKALEPGPMLERFVSERAASDDYRKLLGVVALIRRDFKKLSDLLGRQGNTELRDAVKKKLRSDTEERERLARAESAAGQTAAAGGAATAEAAGTVAVAAGEAKPEGADAAGPDDTSAAPEVTDKAVSEKLEEYRIDRIVLYIDDLDRCPPKQVVDVLQAIHLLLAFELFVVVVGVDARWVRHSLRKRFPGLLGGSGEEDEDGDSSLIRAATPRDYIEKIFQVPFWLRPMNPQASADLLEGLIPNAQLRLKADGEGREESGADGEGRERPAPSPAAQTVAAGGSVQGRAAPSDTVRSVEREAGGAGADRPAPAAADPQGAGREDGRRGSLALRSESLLLEPKEREAMMRLAKVIGRTPRTLKRFVNVYRIIRAGLKGQRLAAFKGTGDEVGEYRAVLVLLGVAHGAPDVAPFFFRALNQWHQQKKPDEQRAAGLKDFLMELHAKGDAHPVVKKLSAEHPRPPDLFTVVNDLTEFANSYVEDIPAAELRRWMPVVVRYTFQLGRMAEEFA